MIGKYRIEKIEDEYQKENQKLQEEQIHNLFQLGREANRLRHDMSATSLISAFIAITILMRIGGISNYEKRSASGVSKSGE